MLTCFFSSAISNHVRSRVQIVPLDINLWRDGKNSTYCSEARAHNTESREMEGFIIWQKQSWRERDFDYNLINFIQIRLNLDTFSFYPPAKGLKASGEIMLAKEHIPVTYPWAFPWKQEDIVTWFKVHCKNLFNLIHMSNDIS